MPPSRAPPAAAYRQGLFYKDPSTPHPLSESSASTFAGLVRFDLFAKFLSASSAPFCTLVDLSPATKEYLRPNSAMNQQQPILPMQDEEEWWQEGRPLHSASGAVPG